MPEYFLTQKYPTGLEEDFTVVWRDRRKTMTVEQSITDTLAVTNNPSI